MSLALFIIPVICMLIAQVIKGIIHGVKHQFSWKDFVAPGGFPSGHAALVTSLAVMVGYFYGTNSAVFAIAIILAFVIIWDAGVLRQIVGKHAQVINRIIHDLPAEAGAKYKHLSERVGHTGWELLGGIILSFIITAIYILFL